MFAAWGTYETPAVFVPLYSVSVALDGNVTLFNLFDLSHQVWSIDHILV